MGNRQGAWLQSADTLRAICPARGDRATGAGPGWAAKAAKSFTLGLQPRPRNDTHPNLNGSPSSPHPHLGGRVIKQHKPAGGHVR